MGNSVGLSVVANFDVKDKEKSNEIINFLFEDEYELSDSERNGSCSIETGLAGEETSRDIMATNQSEAQGWETIMSMPDGFSLYIDFYNCEVSFEDIEKAKRDLSVYVKKIEEKYGLAAEFSVYGTYG